MVRLPVAKSDPRCGCVTDHYECGRCRGINRQRIWRTMTPEAKAYDRMVDPANSAVLDRDRYADLDLYERGCTCHLCAPCSWCLDQPDPDAIQPKDTRHD